MKRRRSKFQLTRTFAATETVTRPKLSRPFSIRLSDAERSQLAREAGSQALGTYVRARLLTGAARRRRSGHAATAAELGLILGKLGHLPLASSLAALATAAQDGRLIITPDLESDLQAACRNIQDMRVLLMQALGLKAEARV